MVVEKLNTPERETENEELRSGNEKPARRHGPTGIR
jgi:hypothetical protein